MKQAKQIELLVRGLCVRHGQALVCRNRKKGNLYLPGGHIEPGEESRAALEREIKEEMGLDGRVRRFLGVAEHTFRHKGRRVCEVNLAFELQLPGLRTSQPPPSCEAHLEFLWLPLKGLVRAGLEPRALMACLPRWLAPAFDGERWCSSYS